MITVRLGLVTAAQFLTLRLILIGSTQMGYDDPDGPGHAPQYLDVRRQTMKKPTDFVSFLTNLVSHGKSLHYKDKYGAVVKLAIQPIAKLDKLNSDPKNAKVLSECGIKQAAVIGSDEHGVPVLLDCESLKTYLLDPASTGPDCIKNAITILTE